mmetsp:Transcript_54320/g.118157  ORF Transcript_54320/g.118157 Transcript_54320/m.118157 type:complete len:116 (+) Transcript_54320:318-665(+)
MGTALQVAPVCALPNLCPSGATRVLVNRPIADCVVNPWSQQSSFETSGFGSVSSLKLGGRPVTLRPLWLDRKGRKRWRQGLFETDCDDFVRRFFASEHATSRGLILGPAPEAQDT